MKHGNSNVLSKPCLYNIRIKRSKLVNAPLKVGFLNTEAVNLLFSLQIVTSKMGFIFFNFKSEFDVRMLVINLIKKFK